MHLVTFGGLAFAAAPGKVMVPRRASGQVGGGPAESLRARRSPRVVDVGTGSGAIALGLAAEIPHARIFATDTNPAAVALAGTNAARLGLDGRVTVLHGDLLEPVPGTVDLIAANLPYLPAAAAVGHPELAGEPPEAVFAPGDGLGPYRRLLAASRERLGPRRRPLLLLRRR